MPVKAYLTRTMLRRLLACLALITGLAAIGAPAQASVYQTASGVELAAGIEKPCKGEACECPTGRRHSQLGARQKVPCKPAPVITIVIPTVQFGADRAYE